MENLNFTAIDFEAANASKLSAISAGYAVVRGGEVIKTGTWIINPHTGLDNFNPYAVRIHGITPEHAAAGEPLETSIRRLLDIIGDGPVLAHGMKYDRGILTAGCREFGLPKPANEFRCTLTLAKTVLQLDKLRLSAVTEALGLPAYAAHDSGADALACARVALAIAERQGAQTITGLYKGLGIS